MESTLTRMGDGLVRTIKDQSGEIRVPVFLDHTKKVGRVTGRVLGVETAKETGAYNYLYLDGIDGRAHNILLASSVDATDVPVGSIVTAKSAAEPRPADFNIVKVSVGGRYDSRRHLEMAMLEHREDRDPVAYVQTHVNRLKALHRAGIVERESDQIWRIPRDFLDQTSAYNAARADGASIRIESRIPVEEQVRSLGATWLDSRAGRPNHGIASHHFGAVARKAIAEREDFLVEQGLAERQNGRLLTHKLHERLQEREITQTARLIESETGRKHLTLKHGERIKGTYRRSITLNSGRFALIETPTHFSLLPWRPVMERELGRSVSAIVSGKYVTWKFARKQDLSR